MAYSNDITLDANTTFSRTVTGRNYGVFSNPASVLEKPEDLTVSHETTKSGLVNSVVIITNSDIISCGDTSSCSLPVSALIKAQFKLSYNPKVGFTDLTQQLADIRTQISEFINTPALWAKFLNKES